MRIAKRPNTGAHQKMLVGDTFPKHPNFSTNFKKVLKKILLASALPPLPPLNDTAIKKIIFFGGFPKGTHT